MSAAELDPAFRYALKLLHSSSADSAEKIRNSLDELIKQRHGSSKMLVNTLNKKYLAEESSAPGVVQRRQSHRSSDSKASSSNSPQQIVTTESSTVVTTPVVISVPDDDDEDDLIMEEAHLQEFQDLNCVVCRRIDASAKNRLIECSDCQSLYHQECHNPQISEIDATENQDTWCCSVCKNKIKSSSVASPAKSSCSTSSSSSSSYQKHVSSKSYEPSSAVASISSKSSSKSSKHKSKHSSKSHSSSNQASASGIGIIGGNSSSNNGNCGATSKTPVTINIISADKRLQNMKKKAAKLQETRRKHK